MTTTELDDPKLIIRTSDRGQFRKCRELWNFTSKIRLNWEWVPGIDPLDFGIAVHKGMEVYYDPERWNDERLIVEAEAHLAFMAVMNDWKRRLIKSDNWEARKATWNEHKELGTGMLNHYFMWAPRHDLKDDWEPIKTEIEFEVPIPVPDTIDHLRWEFSAIDGNLYQRVMPEGSDEYVMIPVVYQGRIDLIIRNKRTGKYWIVDHKTAAQFGQTEHLELDPQCGSYCWAIQKILGINVDGVIYQELRKKVPKEPTVLQSGELSQNKAQGTTAELYEKAILDGGYNPEPYAAFVQTLRESQQEYFRRLTVHRSQRELEILEHNICLEAIDMLNDPSIYPNPSRWNCNGCAMRTPCLLKQEGSDWQWHLEHSQQYAVRA
jgi:hypothetical protein